MSGRSTLLAVAGLMLLVGLLGPTLSTSRARASVGLTPVAGPGPGHANHECWSDAPAHDAAPARIAGLTTR